MTLLRIATWNIHKGFSQWGRRLMVHELRERLRELAPDIVFLQEVQGLHLGHVRRHVDWPSEPQHEFLAQGSFTSAAYGRNMIYDHGHHGNALLSRLPLIASSNQDVTHLWFERRGLLHASLALPNGVLHCVCVHLSLLGASRRRQLQALVERLEAMIPTSAPLIIAGDFNDWRNRAHSLLAERLGLTEAFTAAAGRPSRSFPAVLPLLRLDRLYVRGLKVIEARRHDGPPWSQISDHAPLSAVLSLE